MEEYERPIATAFGNKLKAAREAAGLTMAALGAQVMPPMHATAIARYETGARVPTWTAVVRLALALGKTPDHFLPEEMSPKRKRT
jgi:transcriptional regulator with XRE-family HTH domain